jgi:predicted phosphohydrolase
MKLYRRLLTVETDKFVVTMYMPACSDDDAECNREHLFEQIRLSRAMYGRITGYYTMRKI